MRSQARSLWTFTAVSRNGTETSKPHAMLGAAIEQAIQKLESQEAEKSRDFVSLTAINENGLQSHELEAVESV